MKVIAGTREFQIEEPTVVTIGKFDGRHKGHQKLLQKMLALKEQNGLCTAIFTFDMAPAGVVSGKKQSLITTNQERRNNMEKTGIDYMVEYPFDQQVAHMLPEEFVAGILIGQMNARAIVAGTDCGFGYKRAGDAALLKRLGPKYGFQAVIIEKEQDQHRDISSTYVREQLEAGNIEKANALLGQPYAIHGVVVHGNHIGAPILGFPTANILPPPEKYLPRFGVYVSRVLVEGRYYGGVTNIGRKPTITGENPVGVETFILGLEENLDIYGKNIEVQLLDFDRPEIRFTGLDALKERIEMDKQYAEEYFRRHPDWLGEEDRKKQQEER